MITIIVISLLILLAGISNSIMDTLMFHYQTSIFSKLGNWFDFRNSWVNKWAYIKESEKVYRIIPYPRRPWYYLFLYRLKYKERFPYSSTILVLFTDAWHFCKWLMFTCVELSLTLLLEFGYPDLAKWYYIVGTVLMMKVVRGIGFTLFFDTIWNKKDVSRN